MVFTNGISQWRTFTQHAITRVHTHPPPHSLHVLYYVFFIHRLGGWEGEGGRDSSFSFSCLEKAYEKLYAFSLFCLQFQNESAPQLTDNLLVILDATFLEQVCYWHASNPPPPPPFHHPHAYYYKKNLHFNYTLSNIYKQKQTNTYNAHTKYNNAQTNTYNAQTT